MFRLFVLIFLALFGLAIFFFFSAGEEDRALALRVLRGGKSVLYEEATLHNPEGDVVPDDLDDTLLERVKKALLELAKRKTPC